MRFRPLRSSPRSQSAGAAGGAPADVPERMRAVVLDGSGSPDGLRAARVPVPARILSEVLVRVVAAGLNPVDVKTRAGKGVASGIPEFPVVPGFDFSGVVVEAPFDCSEFPPGTEVFGMVPFPRTGGTLAEYAIVPMLSLAEKPASLSHFEAAGVPLAALTAWGLIVEIARAHEGQRILIHAGSGGVGHFAVQLAAYFGAHVIATASGRNVPWLRDLGASVVVDYSTTRFEDVVGEVDVVIDLIGNVHDDTGARSIGVLRPGGLYVLVPTGSWAGWQQAAADAGVRATNYYVIPDGNALATVGRLLDSGAIQVYVDRVFDLDDAASAYAELERGHTRGKIVLRLSDD